MLYLLHPTSNVMVRQERGEQFGRMITAMVTPFHEGAGQPLNTYTTTEVAKHLMSNCSTAIVVCGTTGESPTLSELERISLANTVLETVGDHIPVIAGTSTYDTRESIHLSRRAQSDGVHGLLLVTPYYNKPSQEGLKRHFGAIAEATQGEIPIILYDVPSRTNVNIEPETVWWLAENYSSIVGLKEARGLTTEKDRHHVARILLEKPFDFTVWSGNDADTYHFLEHGGYGVVSVASHIVGRQIDKMISLFMQGKIDEAQAQDRYVQPLAQALFPLESPEPSPSAIKACLNIAGMPVGGLRLPLIEEPLHYQVRLADLMTGYHLDLGLSTDAFYASLKT